MKIKFFNAVLQRSFFLGMSLVLAQAFSACTTTEDAENSSEQQEEIEAGENPESTKLDVDAEETNETATESSANDMQDSNAPLAADESLSAGDIGTLDVGAPVDVPSLPPMPSEEVEPNMAEEPMQEAVAVDKVVETEVAPVINEPVAQNEAITSGEYIVLPGDTLAKIAKKIYGSSSRWQKLASDNQLKNVNKIFPGDKLKYDSDSASEKFKGSQAESLASFEVKKGQNLSSIAKALYGDSSYWRVIWRLNEAEISNPNTLSVGSNIRVIKARGKALPSH